MPCHAVPFSWCELTSHTRAIPDDATPRPPGQSYRSSHEYFLIGLPALAICDSVLFLIYSYGATMNFSHLALSDLRALQSQVNKQL
jgi:hypothetical protein